MIERGSYNDGERQGGSPVTGSHPGAAWNPCLQHTQGDDVAAAQLLPIISYNVMLPGGCRRLNNVRGRVKYVMMIVSPNDEFKDGCKDICM